MQIIVSAFCNGRKKKISMLKITYQKNTSLYLNRAMNIKALLLT
nr:MAG TPA: hypothetical protein [Caudoviricetes sp.]